jgi:Trk-type K+ transport system membrane component
VFFYFFLSIFSILILIGTESIEPLPIAFEVISALSTVGLSMGVTAEFSLFGKFWLMFLMLAGRVGLVSILYAGLGNSKATRYRLPEGQFYVG